MSLNKKVDFSVNFPKTNKIEDYYVNEIYNQRYDLWFWIMIIAYMLFMLQAYKLHL